MDDLALARDEIAALEAEVAALEVELAAPGPRGVSLLALMAGIAVLGVGLATVFSLVGSGGAETMYGEVVAVSGPAPVAQGARCTLVSWPSSGEEFDLQLELRCGGRVVYGGGSLGHVDCDSWRAGAWWSCRDTDSSAGGGDPALALDREARAVRVEDRDPTFAFEVSLTTPPAGTRADR
jgi:hypothetical protein